MMNKYDDDERGCLSLLSLVVLGVGDQQWISAGDMSVHAQYIYGLNGFLTSPEGVWRLCEGKDRVKERI
jgi:hypothetical protein